MPYKYWKSGISEPFHVLSYATLHYILSKATILILSLVFAAAKYYLFPLFNSLLFEILNLP